MGMARFFHAVEEDKLSEFLRSNEDDEDATDFLYENHLQMTTMGESFLIFKIEEFINSCIADIDVSFKRDSRVSEMDGGYFPAKEVKGISNFLDKTYPNISFYQQIVDRECSEDEKDFKQLIVDEMENLQAFFKSASEKNLAVTSYYA